MNRRGFFGFLAGCALAAHEALADALKLPLPVAAPRFKRGGRIYWSGTDQYGEAVDRECLELTESMARDLQMLVGRRCRS